MRIWYQKETESYWVYDSYGFPIGNSKTLEGAKKLASSFREQMEKDI